MKRATSRRLARPNLHSGIMFTSPHVNAIIHAHTLDGAAVGAMKGGFQPLTQDGAMVYPKVRYLDYDGIVVLPGEGEASAKALGPDGRVLILKNHGTLSVGATMGEAFFYFYFFEKACSIQVRALATRRASSRSPRRSCRRCRPRSRSC